jgi:hypothetical protein
MTVLKRSAYDGCLTFEPRKSEKPEDILKKCRDTFDMLMELEPEQCDEDPFEDRV